MSEASTVPTVAEITGQTDLNRTYEERFGFRVGLMAVSQLRGCLSKTNPRKHDERNLEAIKRSIKNFGFKGFVGLDRELEVIYGHGRIEGADRAGLSELPVLIIMDLDKLEAEGLRLADNQTGDLSTWDPALVSAALERLSAGGKDPIQVGFDKDALDALGKALAAGEAPEDGEWADALGQLPADEKSPYQQKTFTLHDTQVPAVDKALAAAKAAGEFQYQNENSNGNALTRVCEFYLEHGDGQG